MLKYLTIVGALFVASGAYAQSSGSTGAVHVTVDSEVKNLAQGYARAAGRLSRPPIKLAFQKEGVTLVLEDVRTVQDVEGVLAVEVSKGFIYLINPKDVVYITDGAKLVPKP